MALYVKFECDTCENENCTGHGLPTTEKICDGYKHTTTNADRIRSMSDEELAEWLADHPIVSKYDKNNPQHKAWLDWLKQKAEE